MRMHLKFEDGRKMLITGKSVFDYNADHHMVEVLVDTTGRGNFRHVSWQYTTDEALKQIEDIATAFRRGDKVYTIID